MAQQSDYTMDEMKAERKRLATARGLLTRERNKLAAERQGHQALLEELATRQSALAQESQRLAGWQAELEARERDAITQLAQARRERKALRKTSGKSIRKRAKKYADKKARKKLAKAYAKIKKLEKTAQESRSVSEDSAGRALKSF